MWSIFAAGSHLDQPFAEILAQIPLSDAIKQALWKNGANWRSTWPSSPIANSLNWERLKLRADKMSLSEKEAIGLFMESTQWGRSGDVQ